MTARTMDATGLYRKRSPDTALPAVPVPLPVPTVGPALLARPNAGGAGVGGTRGGLPHGSAAAEAADVAGPPPIRADCDATMPAKRPRTGSSRHCCTYSWKGVCGRHGKGIHKPCTVSAG
jgi:hypothetical protein